MQRQRPVGHPAHTIPLTASEHSTLLIVRQAVKDIAAIDNSCSIDSLGRNLAYEHGLLVILRKGGGGGFGNLRHEYLLVQLYTGGDAIVVDMQFRERFQYACLPGGTYASCVAALPSLFIGTLEAVKCLAKLMSDALAREAAARGHELPPWRSRQALLSNWLPQQYHDVRYAPPQPAALHPVLRRACCTGYVGEDGSGVQASAGDSLTALPVPQGHRQAEAAGAVGAAKEEQPPAVATTMTLQLESPGLTPPQAFWQQPVQQVKPAGLNIGPLAGGCSYAVAPTRIVHGFQLTNSVCASGRSGTPTAAGTRHAATSAAAPPAAAAASPAARSTVKRRSEHGEGRRSDGAASGGDASSGRSSASGASYSAAARFLSGVVGAGQAQAQAAAAASAVGAAAAVNTEAGVASSALRTALSEPIVRFLKALSSLPPPSPSPSVAGQAIPKRRPVAAASLLTRALQLEAAATASAGVAPTVAAAAAQTLQPRPLQQQQQQPDPRSPFLSMPLPQSPTPLQQAVPQLQRAQDARDANEAAPAGDGGGGGGGGAVPDSPWGGRSGRQRYSDGGTNRVHGAGAVRGCNAALPAAASSTDIKAASAAATAVLAPPGRSPPALAKPVPWCGGSLGPGSWRAVRMRRERWDPCSPSARHGFGSPSRSGVGSPARRAFGSPARHAFGSPARHAFGSPAGYLSPIATAAAAPPPVAGNRCDVMPRIHTVRPGGGR